MLVRGEMVEMALREIQLGDDAKDHLKKKATRLTLDQQQKLCIARLLPLNPRVILMDELCSALDAEGIERVEELKGPAGAHQGAAATTRYRGGSARCDRNPGHGRQSS